MLEAIEKIEKFTKDISNATEFSDDQLIFDGCLMNFIVIGEMVSRLDESFKESNSINPLSSSKTMNSDNYLYDTLLKFLYEVNVPVDQEISSNYCWIISKELYQRVQELKELQRRLTNLQITNAEFRDSYGLRFINGIKHRLLGRPKAPDSIQELNRCIENEQLQLRSLLDPMEISDLCFQQYRRCGEQYVRIRPTVLPHLAERFFDMPTVADIATVLHRFRTVREAFNSFPPDLRILGFIAIIGATTPDFDTEEFFKWDTHMIYMIYGKGTSPLHPMTYDRFLIHSVIYSLPSGTIEDRYIAFRIGWEMFKDKFGRHFDYQLMTLVSAAHLLRDLETFPKDESAFREFYQKKLERYYTLMKSIHHRVRAPDDQKDKGANIIGSNLEIDISINFLAKIGIPDSVFVVASRLAGFPTTVYAIYERLSELIKAFNKMNDPIQIASILADTPLYFADRKDQRDTYKSDEPGTFIKHLQERIHEANQLDKTLGLNNINAALVALQPGPVESSIKIMEELSHLLSDVPKPSKRMVISLLMDGVTTMVQNRRFIYELCHSERLI